VAGTALTVSAEFARTSALSVQTAQLKKEVHGRQKKRGCPVCSHNLSFSRRQLEERESRLQKERVEGNQIVRENERLKTRAEELLDENGSRRMRLNELEREDVRVEVSVSLSAENLFSHTIKTIFQAVT